MTAGLGPRYPTGGKGVGAGGGEEPALETRVVAGLVARPPWCTALLFLNLKARSMGSDRMTRVLVRGLGRPNLHTPRRHVQLFS